MRGRNAPDASGDHRVTPRRVWEPCLAALGIEQWDLDPATNAHASLPARRKCDGRRGRDGLRVAWSGHVWFNPPFRSIPPWIEKLAAEIRRGELASATVLVPSDHSPEWWGALHDLSHVMARWQGRPPFVTPGAVNHSPPFPVDVFLWHPRAAARARWRRVLAPHAFTFPIERRTLLR